MQEEINTQLIIIGGGPSSLFLLKNLLNTSNQNEQIISEITVLEKNEILGPGMPFNENYNDIHNLANITGEEIPSLPQTLTQWLKEQDIAFLHKWNIDPSAISEKNLYPRIILGKYFTAQFQLIIEKLKAKDIEVNIFLNEEVVDIKKHSEDKIEVKSQSKKSFVGHKLVISTGHGLLEKAEKNEELNYFSSPWPISKLFPKGETFYNFEIGILGASLSAFDVTSALAHQHGQFISKGNQLKFRLHDGAEGFKIALHSSDGLLPHLQYEQRNAMRKVFRHIAKDEINLLLDNCGFLSINNYFNKVMRPALIDAFSRDKQPEKAKFIGDHKVTFLDFIAIMKEQHHYSNSFEGLKTELKDAIEQLNMDQPTHWMETLDDLMYTLNFHIDLLAAEDRIFLKREIFPFLMNVIAALPIKSAKILTAMYEAGCITLHAGKVEIIKENDPEKGVIISLKEDNKKAVKRNYKKFINCGGQGIVELHNYPFQSLVNDKNITAATARFKSTKVATAMEENDSAAIEKIGEEKRLKLGGIAIDATYRIINAEELVSKNIYDISIQHILGAKPYSYGLQACNANAAVVVNTWINKPVVETIEILESTDVKDIYKENI